MICRFPQYVDVVDDIKWVKHMLVNMGYSSTNRIIIHSRLEAYAPLMLVQLIEEGIIILMIAGEEAKGFVVSNKCDSPLFIDGELEIIGEISWLYRNQMCVFYKHYILSDEYVKVIVDFEDLGDVTVTEKYIGKEERYVAKEERRYQLMKEKGLTETPNPVIPSDW